MQNCCRGEVGYAAAQLAVRPGAEMVPCSDSEVAGWELHWPLRTLLLDVWVSVRPGGCCAQLCGSHWRVLLCLVQASRLRASGTEVNGMLLLDVEDVPRRWLCTAREQSLVCYPLPNPGLQTAGAKLQM